MEQTSLQSILSPQEYQYLQRKRLLRKANSQPHKSEDEFVRDFEFYGGAKQLIKHEGAEVILAGPYETGKTIAALHKLHMLLLSTRNARALMVRKTYKSLLPSAIVTYEHKVLPVPPGHPDCSIRVFGGSRPDWYDYPNGARLVLGGMDNPDKFLSSEFDFIYVNQAEEIELDDWEKLTGRATGRAGNAEYPQILGDCNPSHPYHWILGREPLQLYHSVHKDNPALYDHDINEWTEQGERTLAALDLLTGIRHDRGFKGLWVAAEGVIYDNFELESNVSEDAEYNPDWPVIWGVDDGYAQGNGPGHANYHPRVILMGQITPIGGIHIFDEYYATQELSEVTLANVLDLPYAFPDVAYVDSSAAELKGRIWNAGIQTIGATHTVTEGIKNFRRLVCDGQGMRLLKIHPRCGQFTREMQSYRHDDASRVAVVGESKPLKIDDHGPDCGRYMTWHLRLES